MKNMKFRNKLVYKITLTIMIPVIIISVIVSVFLLKDIAEKTEVEFTNYLEEVVFNYVDYIDRSLINISENATKDALYIENINNITSSDLIALTNNNINSDSLIFGSGIFFDQDMNPFTGRLAYFYSYRFKEDSIIEMIVDEDSDHIDYDYIENNPEWWETPSRFHKGGWTKPYSDTLSGSPSMITYFQPFYFDDEFAGIITIDISLEKLEQWLITNERVLEENLDPSTFLVSTDSIVILSDLPDRIGTKIFDTDPRYSRYNYEQSLTVVSKAVAGETGKEFVSTIDGKSKLIAFFTPLHSTTWAAISLIPYEIIYENVKKGATQVFLIILIFNIVLVIVIILIARLISKPIIKLSKISLKIAEGDYTTKINVKNNDEIGILANNFKLMKNNLRRREEELTESNKKFEIIFANSPFGVIYFDHDLNIVSYNDKLMELIGASKETNYIGENVNALPIHEKSTEFVSKAIKTGEFTSFSSDSFNDSNKHLRININPLDNNNASGAIVTIEDITTEVKNTDLKIETEAALKASESKSLFLANMSHEIRTPMNAIIGLSHLMEKTELNTKQNNYLNKINSSAKLLLGIINDILDFSKIEAGKLTLELASFNLEQMLMDINNIFSYTAAQKGLEFILFIHPEVPKEIKGDELRLKQIIINLLSNAIKFTHDGEIEVSIRVKKESKENICLEFNVRDTGIGMDEEQRAKVFGAFSQADESTTRKYGGTGLGLSISKRLVELMHGEIGVESKPNVGTTFFFDAKLEQVDQKDVLNLLPTPDLEGTKVLVCDDNASARLVISSILKSFTFLPEEFENGISLLEELESSDEKNPDLLILDWQMPEMDGIKVAKRITSSEKIQHKPKIILLTAHSEITFNKEIELSGIDAILYKPVTNSTLFDTIIDVYGKDIPKKHVSLSEKDTQTEKLKEYAGARVLLVEDNEINQEVATELLETMGLVVEVAGNGKIAVTKILEADPARFSLVFMDLQMPVMDGYTATKTIRNNKEFLKLSIVAMTADVMEGVKERCLEFGMKDFVSKPINPAEVVKAVINWAVKPEGVQIKKPKTKRKDHSGEVRIPDIPGLNIESALGRMNNKKKLYVSILEKFYNNNQNFISELKVTLDKGDHETAQRMIHTLKGVTGNVGADSLHKSTKIVETSINEKDSKKIEDELNKLDVELKELFGNISSQLDFASKSESQELNIDLVKEIIPKLKQLLIKKSPKAKVLTKELEEAGLSGEKFEEMVIKLNKYDFKGALQLLDELSM